MNYEHCRRTAPIRVRSRFWAAFVNFLPLHNEDLLIALHRSWTLATRLFGQNTIGRRRFPARHRKLHSGSVFYSDTWSYTLQFGGGR